MNFEPITVELFPLPDISVECVQKNTYKHGLLNPVCMTDGGALNVFKS